jgi:hypothetical protein
MHPPRPLLALLLACALATSACATNDLEDETPGFVPLQSATAVTGGGGKATTNDHRVEVMVAPGTVTPIATPKHRIRLGVGAPRFAQQEVAR